MFRYRHRSGPIRIVIAVSVVAVFGVLLHWISQLYVPLNDAISERNMQLLKARRARAGLLSRHPKFPRLDESQVNSTDLVHSKKGTIPMTKPFSPGLYNKTKTKIRNRKLHEVELLSNISMTKLNNYTGESTRKRSEKLENIKQPSVTEKDKSISENLYNQNTSNENAHKISEYKTQSVSSSEESHSAFLKLEDKTTQRVRKRRDASGIAFTNTKYHLKWNLNINVSRENPHTAITKNDNHSLTNLSHESTGKHDGKFLKAAVYVEGRESDRKFHSVWDNVGQFLKQLFEIENINRSHLLTSIQPNMDQNFKNGAVSFSKPTPNVNFDSKDEPGKLEPSEIKIVTELVVEGSKISTVPSVPEPRGRQGKFILDWFGMRRSSSTEENWTPTVTTESASFTPNNSDVTEETTLTTEKFLNASSITKQTNLSLNTETVVPTRPTKTTLSILTDTSPENSTDGGEENRRVTTSISGHENSGFEDVNATEFLYNCSENCFNKETFNLTNKIPTQKDDGKLLKSNKSEDIENNETSLDSFSTTDKIITESPEESSQITGLDDIAQAAEDFNEHLHNKEVMNYCFEKFLSPGGNENLRNFLKPSEKDESPMSKNVSQETSTEDMPTSAPTWNEQILHESELLIAFVKSLKDDMENNSLSRILDEPVGEKYDVASKSVKNINVDENNRSAGFLPGLRNPFPIFGSENLARKVEDGSGHEVIFDTMNKDGNQLKESENIDSEEPDCVEVFQHVLISQNRITKPNLLDMLLFDPNPDFNNQNPIRTNPPKETLLLKTTARKFSTTERIRPGILSSVMPETKPTERSDTRQKFGASEADEVQHKREKPQLDMATTISSFNQSGLISSVLEGSDDPLKFNNAGPKEIHTANINNIAVSSPMKEIINIEKSPSPGTDDSIKKAGQPDIKRDSKEKIKYFLGDDFDLDSTDNPTDLNIGFEFTNKGYENPDESSEVIIENSEPKPFPDTFQGSGEKLILKPEKEQKFETKRPEIFLSDATFGSGDIEEERAIDERNEDQVFLDSGSGSGEAGGIAFKSDSINIVQKKKTQGMMDTSEHLPPVKQKDIPVVQAGNTQTFTNLLDATQASTLSTDKISTPNAFQKQPKRSRGSRMDDHTEYFPMEIVESGEFENSMNGRGSRALGNETGDSKDPFCQNICIFPPRKMMKLACGVTCKMWNAFALSSQRFEVCTYECRKSNEHARYTCKLCQEWDTTSTASRTTGPDCDSDCEISTSSTTTELTAKSSLSKRNQTFEKCEDNCEDSSTLSDGNQIQSSGCNETCGSELNDSGCKNVCEGWTETSLSNQTADFDCSENCSEWVVTEASEITSTNFSEREMPSQTGFSEYVCNEDCEDWNSTSLNQTVNDTNLDCSDDCEKNETLSQCNYECREWEEGALNNGTVTIGCNNDCREWRPTEPSLNVEDSQNVSQSEKECGSCEKWNVIHENDTMTNTDLDCSNGCEQNENANRNETSDEANCQHGCGKWNKTPLENQTAAFDCIENCEKWNATGPSKFKDMNSSEWDIFPRAGPSEEQCNDNCGNWDTVSEGENVNATNFTCESGCQKSQNSENISSESLCKHACEEGREGVLENQTSERACNEDCEEYTASDPSVLKDANFSQKEIPSKSSFLAEGCNDNCEDWDTKSRDQNMDNSSIDCNDGCEENEILGGREISDENGCAYACEEWNKNILKNRSGETDCSERCEEWSNTDSTNQTALDIFTCSDGCEENKTSTKGNCEYGCEEWNPPENQTAEFYCKGNCEEWTTTDDSNLKDTNSSQWQISPRVKHPEEECNNNCEEWNAVSDNQVDDVTTVECTHGCEENQNIACVHACNEWNDAETGNLTALSDCTEGCNEWNDTEKENQPAVSDCNEGCDENDAKKENRTAVSDCNEGCNENDAEKENQTAVSDCNEGCDEWNDAETENQTALFDCNEGCNEWNDASSSEFRHMNSSPEWQVSSGVQDPQKECNNNCNEWNTVPANKTTNVTGFDCSNDCKEENFQENGLHRETEGCTNGCKEWNKDTLHNDNATVEYGCREGCEEEWNATEPSRFKYVNSSKSETSRTQHTSDECDSNCEPWDTVTENKTLTNISYDCDDCGDYESKHNQSFAKSDCDYACMEWNETVLENQTAQFDCNECEKLNVTEPFKFNDTSSVQCSDNCESWDTTIANEDMNGTGLQFDCTEGCEGWNSIEISNSKDTNSLKLEISPRIQPPLEKCGDNCESWDVANANGTWNDSSFDCNDGDCENHNRTQSKSFVEDQCDYACEEWGEDAVETENKTAPFNCVEDCKVWNSTEPQEVEDTKYSVGESQPRGRISKQECDYNCKERDNTTAGNKTAEKFEFAAADECDNDCQEHIETKSANNDSDVECNGDDCKRNTVNEGASSTEREIATDSTPRYCTHDGHCNTLLDEHCIDKGTASVCDCGRSYVRHPVSNVCKPKVTLETTVRLPDEIFDEKLKDPYSQKFMETKKAAEDMMWMLLRNSPHLSSIVAGVEAYEFSDGSLIVHWNIIFATNENVSVIQMKEFLDEDIQESLHKEDVVKQLPLRAEKAMLLSISLAVNPCDKPELNYCSKHADCMRDDNRPNGFFCTCRKGFSDFSSHKDIYPGEVCQAICPIDHCGEHGTCHITEGETLRCLCYGWFFGDNCEISGVVIVACAATANVILVLLVFICMCCVRRNRNDLSFCQSVSVLKKTEDFGLDSYSDSVRVNDVVAMEEAFAVASRFAALQQTPAIMPPAPPPSPATPVPQINVIPPSFSDYSYSVDSSFTTPTMATPESRIYSNMPMTSATQPSNKNSTTITISH